MTTPDYAKEFSKTSLDPWNWIAKGAVNYVAARASRQMYRKAKVLAISQFENVFIWIGYQYLMCFGLSLECMAKSVIVIRHREELLLPNGHLNAKEYNKRIGTHDIRTLWAECGLNIDENDGYILDILSECVVWMGRYPAPLRFEAVKDFVGKYYGKNKMKWPFVEMHLQEKDQNIINLLKQVTMLHDDGIKILDSHFNINEIDG